MTDQLEFPELKRAYLQSLPSEQAILARMRRPRQTARASVSSRAAYAFALVGAAGLASLVAVFAPRGEEAMRISAEPLHATALAVGAAANASTSSGVVPTEHVVVTDKAPLRQPASIEPSLVTQNVDRKSVPASTTPKLVHTAAPSVKATWSEVGTLMRNGQEAEAQRMIAELAQSEDVETREGAQLFQLRQKVQTARRAGTSVSAEVQAELRKLANTASTSSVRLSAKRLLTDSK